MDSFHMPGEMVVAKIARASFVPLLAQLGVEATIGGSLCITQAQTYFWVAETNGVLVSVAHGTLERIRKVQGKEKTNQPYIIEVLCKDLRAIRFILPGKLQYKQMVTVLESLAYEVELSSLFAFRWKHSFPSWRYDAEKEYIRCGLDRDEHRLTSVNQNYAICDSYPQLLAVPAQATDDLLRGVAEFRSRGRMPVATYLWNESGAALYRCSQPLVGLKNTKCSEDEQLLAIMSGLPLKQAGVHLHIVDARPKVAAVGNKFLGAGMEHVGPGTRYEGCSLEYCNIGNIHTMRGALQKLVEALEISDGRKQEQAIDRSDWKDHITRILSGAIRIVNVLLSGSPVLVHCTDGWDRTAQLTCLTQMMLDPYYRTMEGFAVLIEKEWLSFGHKFAQRHGHGTFAPKYKDTQRAPIFLQFVDCCWQLQQQFPTSFEWNERHLMMMVDACYSNLFGTFLCNTDQERRVLSGVAEGTVSLWAYLATFREDYLNPLFEPREQGRLLPKLSGVQIWRSFYCRAQWVSINELTGVTNMTISLNASSFNSTPKSVKLSSGLRGAPRIESSSTISAFPTDARGRIVDRQSCSDSVILKDIDRKRVSLFDVDNESLSMVPELSDDEEEEEEEEENFLSVSNSSANRVSLGVISVMESFAEPLALDGDHRSEVLEWEALELPKTAEKMPPLALPKGSGDAKNERMLSPRANAAKRRGVKLNAEEIQKLGKEEEERFE